MTDSFSIRKPLPDQTASYDFRISGTDTDYHDRLHLFALFSYMQEAAYFHAEQLQIGAGMLDQQDLCWILLRTAVKLERLPRWGSTVRLKTWQRGVDKLVFLRDFLLCDEFEQPFGIASTEWLIASSVSHRPQRPERVLPPDLLPRLKPPVFDLKAARLRSKITLPPDQPVFSRHADFSDIDRNHHVNNTRYVAWIMDALAAFLLKRNSYQAGQLRVLPGSLNIQFSSEVVLGQKIFFYVQPDETEHPLYQIEARHAADQKTVFLAEVVLT